MAIHLLTARQAQAAANGDHADGGGLALKVHAGGARGGCTATRARLACGARKGLALHTVTRSRRQADR